jgi:hypothetical protein
VAACCSLTFWNVWICAWRGLLKTRELESWVIWVVGVCRHRDSRCSITIHLFRFEHCKRAEKSALGKVWLTLWGNQLRRFGWS